MDAAGENDRTPLHEAASSGHASIVETLLVGGGADPCPRDNQNATPYDLAYNEGHEEVQGHFLVVYVQGYATLLMSSRTINQVGHCIS